MTSFLICRVLQAVTPDRPDREVFNKPDGKYDKKNERNKSIVFLLPSRSRLLGIRVPGGCARVNPPARCELGPTHHPHTLSACTRNGDSVSGGRFVSRCFPSPAETGQGRGKSPAVPGAKRYSLAQQNYNLVFCGKNVIALHGFYYRCLSHQKQLPDPFRIVLSTSFLHGWELFSKFHASWNPEDQCRSTRTLQKSLS